MPYLARKLGDPDRLAESFPLLDVGYHVLRRCAIVMDRDAADRAARALFNEFLNPSISIRVGRRNGCEELVALRCERLKVRVPGSNGIGNVHVCLTGLVDSEERGKVLTKL